MEIFKHPNGLKEIRICGNTFDNEFKSWFNTTLTISNFPGFKYVVLPLYNYWYKPPIYVEIKFRSAAEENHLHKLFGELGGQVSTRIERNCFIALIFIQENQQPVYRSFIEKCLSDDQN
jgi:hypothetical protein